MCLAFMCLEPWPHNRYSSQSETVWSAELFLRRGEDCSSPWLWDPRSQRSSPVSNSVIIHFLHPCWQSFIQSYDRYIHEKCCVNSWGVFLWLLFHLTFSFILSDVINATQRFYQSYFFMLLMRSFTVLQLFFSEAASGSFYMAFASEPDWPVFHFNLPFNSAVALFQLIRELETTHSTSHSFPHAELMEQST